MKKSMGIISGAGPMAGVLLMRYIIEICQKKYHAQKDGDFPYMMLVNVPFSDMLGEFFGKKEKAIQKELDQALFTLEKNKIDIVAMSCNTLHGFLKKRSRNYLFVHMIKETQKKLFSKKALILCTSTSRKKKIYQGIYPSEKNQKIVDAIIHQILQGIIEKKGSIKLSQLIQEEIKKNPTIEQVVLGCTELSLLHQRYPVKKSFNIIDPLLIVSEKVCFEAFKKDKSI